ncbi:MAG: Fic family protein [Nanoarchaeota archaeon]
MYLEQRKTKTGVKYYLAHSFREGGKVHKSRVYLGSNIEKAVLDQRMTKATELLHQQLNSFKIIRSPLKYKFTKREADLVQKLKRHARLKVIHLTEQDWERFTELFTYNTNAIEGSTITQNEVLDIMSQNKWPQAKPKEDISETYGVVNAIKYIRKTKEHISLDLMLQLHNIIFANSKTYAGAFRKRGTEVGIKDGFGTIVHLGAPSGRVIALLAELVKWYNQNKKKLPPVVLAAVIHNQFEYIHPFEDGNGRVGRLLMNNILIKNHMPPVNIQMDNRREYYETLRIFQHSGDIKPTIDIILKEYKRMEKELRKTGKISKTKKKTATKTKAKKSKSKKTTKKKL